MVDKHVPSKPEEAQAVLTPRQVERTWGISAKASGYGTSGFSAALWESHGRKSAQRRRPANDHTHVISVWCSGSTVSELHLDGRLRFKQVRKRGTFQLTRAGEELLVFLTESSGKCVDLYLPAARLRSAVESEFDSAASLELLPLKLETDPVIVKMADEVALELEHPGIASRMALDSASLQLNVSLIRRWSNLSGVLRPCKVSGLTSLQLRRVIDHLNDTLSSDIHLDDLAKLIGLSTYHFARCFRVAVGVPPHRYHTQLRLSRAKEILSNTNLPVSEVAQLVGYLDAGYFTRAFRREFATSPTAFRRSRI